MNCERQRATAADPSDYARRRLDKQVGNSLLHGGQHKLWLPLTVVPFPIGNRVDTNIALAYRPRSRERHVAARDICFEKEL